MKKLVYAVGIFACIVLAGCYNNPETSLRKPGEGPEVISSGPAVGPGTTAGGSTAGPQPAARTHGTEAESHSEAAKPAEAGKEHAAPAHTPAAGAEHR